ncbi:MAG: DUF3077 domain-containing protein [Pseudomonas sp.]|uniref:DUF3077 domain-containing protein n=1 Tax=Pseudomonas sp. TaxID=306 RepID=UPI000D96EC23
MNQQTAVTQASTFCIPDGLPLFSVNAGVPVSDALEQSAILLGCVEHLVLCRDSMDADKHTTVLQYLSELSKALVNASRPAA